MAKANFLEEIGRMVEVRKYLNKLIIIDFEIEKMEFEIFDKKLKFDKWLEFKDWIKIYESIFKLMENTKSAIKYLKNDFKIETFKIHNNTVEVRVIKELLNHNVYQNLLKLENFNNFHQFAVKIQILVIPVKNEIISEIKLASDIPKHRSNTTKNETNIPDVKEYYPSFNEKTDADTIPSYKPSKLVVEMQENEFEPYSPQPIENTQKKKIEKEISPKFHASKNDKNSVPQYKASPIISPSSNKILAFESECSESSPEKKVLTKNIKKNRELRSSVRKKCGYKDYKEMSDSDSEYVTKEGNKNKKIRIEGNIDLSDKNSQNCESQINNPSKDESKEKKKVIENDSHKQKLSTKNWLNKYSIKPESKKTYRLSQKCKIKPNKKPPVIYEPFLTPKKSKLTDEERLILRINDEKDIKVMEDVTEKLKVIIKPSIKVEYRTLHHLQMSTIKNTYENNKELFETQFIKFKNEKFSLRKFDADGLNHMFMHSILDEKELMEMTKFLQNIFEPENIVPEFTDIFLNLLIPEWVLLMYMDEYNLTRCEAIQYLKDQEESNICSQMENSYMNPK